jgi:hypothetical protein
MPINIKNVTLEYKILPIELKADGSCSVTIRKGYAEDFGFIVINCDTIEISAIDTAFILDAHPDANKTRRDDLATAVYTWLITNGHVQAGVIS